MPNRLLIIDADCPSAYRAQSLQEKPLGGTEATIIRISSGLAERGHKVLVAQGARQEREVSISGVEYRPFSLENMTALLPEADAVVVLNSPKLLKKARKAYPEAGLYLWMHCYPGKRRRKMINKYAAGAGARIITVSETLRKHIEDCLSRFPEYGRHSRTGGRLAPVQTVFNPVDDHLQPGEKTVDQNKLVFFSSPHKGLDQVLAAFAEVRKRWPEMRLYLANPGYFPLPQKLGGHSVEKLGSLLHAEVIEHVREAFCVFYPQNRFKETFGLVFAEANAVGTPVLTHELGAAREVLANKQQLVDVSDKKQVVERLSQWLQQGRPKVRLPEKFRLRKVLDAWEQLLMKQQMMVKQAR